MKPICLLLFSSTALAAPDLKTVLQKLGEDAKAREATAPCTFKEVTTVEALDKNDEVVLQQQKDTKGKKPARSALHPESQPDYVFALKPGTGDSSTLTIEPIKANSERMRGEADVNAKLEMTELRLTPSKVPLLLKSLALRFTFTDTACGRQANLVEVNGQGVAVFIDTKFHTRSLLVDHARVVKKK